MSGGSTMDLTGVLSLATARRGTDIPLNQSISGIELKSNEYVIPINGVETDIPLNLSKDVDEVLFLHLYSPGALIITIGTNDAENPSAAPIRCGLKGHWIMTCTPDRGIVSLSAMNMDAETDMTLAVDIGSKAVSTDAPSFWNEET